MSKHRWNFVPICLIVGGVVVAFASTAAAWESMGWLQVGVYLGGAAALASIYWLRSEDPPETLELQEQRRLLEEAKKQLQIQADLLENREEKFSRKLIAFQEWTEYPQPIDLSSGGDARGSRAAELFAKDKQVLEFLEAESKRVYQKVASNGYAQNGKFSPMLLRDDIYGLVSHVAKIYNPQSENPLLETSAEKLLRAFGRASLHLLVVLERLPLNVKDYDIAAIYGYVRTGVKAVDVYKATAPWLPYAKGAGYLSRFVLGASPMSLGAWWLLSEVSSRGAKKLVNHLVDYQAVALMHDFVRVIGYEVASIYGGDFRYRDPNWIYGAELTELISRFPTSREGYRHAMQEIGALLLRNEYDRIFLYRCIASHKSAKPERFAAEQLLDEQERRDIAKRLENFFKQYVHGKSQSAADQWKEKVEERLHVRLEIRPDAVVARSADLVEQAIRSLAAFLLSQKEKEPHELAAALSVSELFREMEEQHRQRLLEQLESEPNYVFDPPDLDASSELAEKYLTDLRALAANTPPYNEESDAAIADVASFFRKDSKESAKALAKAYRTALAERFPQPPASSQPPTPLVKQILLSLEEGEVPLLLYSDAVIEMTEGESAPDYGQCWLLGTDRRLLLWGTKPRPEIVWKGTPADSHVAVVEGYVINDCRVSGGQWLIERQPLSLRVPGSMTSRYRAYFRPLLEYGQPV